LRSDAIIPPFVASWSQDPIIADADECGPASQGAASWRAPSPALGYLRALLSRLRTGSGTSLGRRADIMTSRHSARIDLGSFAPQRRKRRARSRTRLQPSCPPTVRAMLTLLKGARRVTHVDQL
jgi:hypothetical protein